MTSLESPQPSFHSPSGTPTHQTPLSPQLLVAGLPDLLGFTPEESLVVIAIGEFGSRVVATMRVDLPDVEAPPEVDAFCDWITGPLSEAAVRSDAMVVIGITPSTGAIVNLLGRVATTLRRDGMDVWDCLLVDAHRWSSVWCQDASCCPVGGRQISPALVEQARLVLSLSGATPVGTRADLEAELLPSDEVIAGIEEAGEISPDAFEVAVAHAIAILSSAASFTRADLSLVCRALADVRVRDTVLWDLLKRGPFEGGWARSVERLTRIVRAAPDPFVAPAATCLAILRWQMGDGARAAIALDRALSADQGYRLAAIVRDCVTSGMHPQRWRGAVCAMDRSACRGVVGSG